MRRISSQTVHRLNSLFQPAHLQVAFSRPCAGELHPLILTVRQIQAEAHGPGQLHALAPLIDQPCTACENPASGKDRIEQFQNDPGHRIFQRNRQRLRLLRIFRIGCRKPGKFWFSVHDLMALIDKIRDPAAVFLKDFHSRMTEIRRTVHPVLLPDMLQRKRPVPVKYRSGHGPAGSLHQIREILLMMNPAAKIQLSQMAVRQYGHEITDLFIIQMKCLCSLIK